eukprot:1150287-Pelagomonas_calceolata.AAC.3
MNNSHDRGCAVTRGVGEVVTSVKWGGEGLIYSASRDCSHTSTGTCCGICVAKELCKASGQHLKLSTFVWGPPLAKMPNLHCTSVTGQDTDAATL